MGKILTGEELLKALSEGSLKEPLILEGMVKQVEDEKDKGGVLFSHGMSCESWVNIPIDIIEKAEFISTVPCLDHEHPLVKLHLKEPQATNTAAALYVDLLKQVYRREKKGGGSPFFRREQLQSVYRGGPTKEECLHACDEDFLLDKGYCMRSFDPQTCLCLAEQRHEICRAICTGTKPAPGRIC